MTQDQEAKFRVSLSYREINLFLSYIKADKENIIENSELAKRLDKQAKKIAFNLLDPAYISSPTIPSSTSLNYIVKEAEKEKGQSLREKFQSGTELSEAEQDSLASYLINDAPDKETFSPAERELINSFMTKQVFGSSL